MLCPLPQTVLTGLRVSSPGSSSSSSALPGISLNSTVETSFGEKAVALAAKEPGAVSSASFTSQFVATARVLLQHANKMLVK